MKAELEDLKQWELEWQCYTGTMEDALYAEWRSRARSPFDATRFDELVAGVRAAHAFPFRAWWAQRQAS